MASAVRDPRLKRVAWRDLVPLNLWERVWELTLSIPWLAGSLAAYAAGWWWVGVVASFFFFLTGLRQSHNAQHSCLGIGRRAHDVMLFMLSVAMLASMHAVRVTHLHHHRHCLEEDDIEAAHAGHRWWRVLLTGPLFTIRLHMAAWRLGRRGERAWIAAELVAVAALLVVVFGVVDVVCLRWHAAAMVAGEMFTGFFAVWTVHHGCHADGQIARTQRGWLKNIVSYSMFYHLEHHLFPAVPTCKLDVLAERLDAVLPEVREKQVM